MAALSDAPGGRADGLFAQVGSDPLPEEERRVLSAEARVAEAVEEVVVFEVAANVGGRLTGVAVQAIQATELQGLAGGVVDLKPANSGAAEPSGSGVETGPQQDDLIAAFSAHQGLDAAIDPCGSHREPELGSGVDLGMAFGQAHSKFSGELGRPRVLADGLLALGGAGPQAGDEQGGLAVGTERGALRHGLDHRTGEVGVG